MSLHSLSFPRPRPGPRHKFSLIFRPRRSARNSGQQVTLLKGVCLQQVMFPLYCKPGISFFNIFPEQNLEFDTHMHREASLENEPQIHKLQKSVLKSEGFATLKPPGSPKHIPERRCAFKIWSLLKSGECCQLFSLGKYCFPGAAFGNSHDLPTRAPSPPPAPLCSHVT